MKHEAINERNENEYVLNPESIGYDLNRYSIIKRINGHYEYEVV